MAKCRIQIARSCDLFIFFDEGRMCDKMHYNEVL